VREWNKIKVGEFLFERAGKYKADAEEIVGLKRIDKIDFSGNFHIAQKPSKTNMILIKPGDLVISGINVAKGAMGIYGGNEDVTATIHYSSYTFDKDQISVEYFKRFLRSPEFIKLLKEQVKGGIKTEIKPKHLSPLKISLPTLEKQQDIASHFQKFESGKDKLKNEITHQQTLLKKLRQQILQEAIQGKLTADFRAQNPDIEPAGELLARIKAEKEQLIKEKKIKKQKNMPPISEEEIPFELPAGWVWCRLGELIESATNGLYKKASFYNDDGIASLRMYNIQNGEIEYKKIRRVNLTDNEVRRYELKNNDLLLNRVNSKELVGKTAIIRTPQEKLVYESMNMRIRLISKESSEFINIFILTNETKDYFSNISKVANGQVSINQGHVFSLIVVLPPLVEQKAIVTKVEKLLAICDQLETQITTDQTHTEQLMQAVLKEAFSQSGEAYMITP